MHASHYGGDLTDVCSRDSQAGGLMRPLLSSLPELIEDEPATPMETLRDICAGLAVTALWIALLFWLVALS